MFGESSLAASDSRLVIQLLSPPSSSSMAHARLSSTREKKYCAHLLVSRLERLSNTTGCLS
ncbi:hypothetical protein D3C81_1756400 [compost metagenome]